MSDEMLETDELNAILIALMESHPKSSESWD